MVQPITENQWDYVKNIKDEIRDYSLNVNHVIIRNVTRGTLPSGIDPNVWNDEYENDTISDIVVSGEFWELMGQNYEYVQGGTLKETDAQFLTHANHRNKFNDATEIWDNVLFKSGEYIPDYISGTNDFISGESYQVISVKRLPFNYEISCYLKLKRPND